MIKKTEKLVITFYTTTDAMAMERICKEKNADGRLIPVPRAIYAGCGLAWCANVSSEATLIALMQESGIAHQGIHICLI